jgi:hypothetical protein
MMWRSVQMSVVFVLVAVLASCGGTSVATPVPTAPPTATETPTEVPTPSPTATAVPVATATAKTAKPSASGGPRPSASPDIAAIIGSMAKSFTATIRFLDLADGDLAVTVAFVDPSSPQVQALGTYTLGSSGQQSNKVPPGTYRLAFRQPSTSKTGPTCTITIAKGSVYTFVAVPGAIAVSRAGYTPTKAADLFVPTSSVCRK